MLTRTTSGLRYSENFESLPVGIPPGWNSFSFTSSTVSYVVAAPIGGGSKGMLVELTAGDGDFVVWPDVLEDSYTTGVIQAQIYARDTLAFSTGDNVRPGLMVRTPDVHSIRSWLSHWIFDPGGEGLKIATDSQSASTANNFVKNNYYHLRLSIENDLIDSRVYSVAGVPIVSDDITPLDDPPQLANWGLYGIQAAALGLSCFFDNIYVYASTYVTINALPAGWKLRIGSQVAVEVGGVATVNYTGLFPVTDVEILDSGDVLQETFTPSGGVFGGDVYQYITETNTPILTLDDITCGVVTLSGSAFAGTGVFLESVLTVRRVDTEVVVYTITDDVIDWAIVYGLLPFGIQLEASVVYRDTTFVESDPSAWVQFTVTEPVHLSDLAFVNPINGGEIVGEQESEIVWNVPTITGTPGSGEILEYHLEIDRGEGAGFVILQVGLGVNNFVTDLSPFIGRQISLRVSAYLDVCGFDQYTSIFEVISPDSILFNQILCPDTTEATDIPEGTDVGFSEIDCPDSVTLVSEDEC